MLFGALAALLIATLPAPAQAPSPAGAWVEKKPLPVARNEVALAAVGGKLYVVGGGIAGNAVPLIDEYDPAADTLALRARRCRRVSTISASRWSTARSSPSAASSARCIAARSATSINTIPRPTTGATLAPLKSPRGSVGVTVLDGKIHAVGGRGVDNTFTVGTHEVYDPATGQWSERAACRRRATIWRWSRSTASSTPSAAASPTRRAAPTEHDIYDPKTNSWSPAPPLPTARSGLAYALYRGMIVVLGGELPPDTFAENEAFDPKSMRWRTLAAMPAGRHGTSAAVIGKNIYVAAGSLKPGSGGVTDQLIVFTMP